MSLHQPRNPRPRGADDGAALILSLVLIVVVGVVVAALLSLVFTNLKSTQVAAARTAQRYAADAAIERAIEVVRNDRTICNGTADGAPMSALVVNGITVNATCQATAGLPPGAQGWALITTATAQPGITLAAGSGPVTVLGPVFSARLDDSAPMVVEGGRVREKQSASSCSGASNKPPGLTVRPDPPYGYDCTTDALPTTPHALPAARPGAAPAPTTVNGCRVFRPGSYTTAPALSSDNRFISGTYYFHDVGRFLIQNAVVVGGERPDESRVHTGSSACDVVDDSGGVGTGVTWIFGGSSWLEVGVNADVELYNRLGGDAGEGQTGISLQAVTAPAPANMTVSNRGLANPLVRVAPSTPTAQLSIHGAVYAPESFVEYSASTSGKPQLRGGLVVGRIQLWGPAAGMVVSS